MHRAAFSDAEYLADAGLYRFRKGAEPARDNSPEIVRRMHAHVRRQNSSDSSVRLLRSWAGAGNVFLRDRWRRCLVPRLR